MTIVYNTCALHRPNGADFMRGVRSAFNLSGSAACDFHFADGPEDADREAMINDWFAVYEDLAGAADRTMH